MFKSAIVSKLAPIALLSILSLALIASIAQNADIVSEGHLGYLLFHEPLFNIFWPVFGLLFFITGRSIYFSILERGRVDKNFGLLFRLTFFGLSAVIFGVALVDNIFGQEEARDRGNFYMIEAEIQPNAETKKRVALHLDYCLMPRKYRQAEFGGFDCESFYKGAQSCYGIQSQGEQSILSANPIKKCLKGQFDLKKKTSVRNLPLVFSTAVVNVVSLNVGISSYLLIISAACVRIYQYASASPIERPQKLRALRDQSVSVEENNLFLLSIFFCTIWLLFRLSKDFYLGYGHFELSSNSVTISFVIMLGLSICGIIYLAILRGADRVAALGMMGGFILGVLAFFGYIHQIIFEVIFTKVSPYVVPGLIAFFALGLYVAVFLLTAREDKNPDEME